MNQDEWSKDKAPIWSQNTVPLGSPGTPGNPRKSAIAKRRSLRISISIVVCVLFVIGAAVIIPSFIPQGPLGFTPLAPHPTKVPTAIPTPTPTPFDPLAGAVLPTHRIVAFYAIPGAEVTGPAFEPSLAMLEHLQNQGAEYEQLDPAHPVKLGIDLVVSIPDGFPGDSQTYSHHVDADTIQSYVDFCGKHDLLLFLDLNFGQSAIQPEVDFFLPYLEKYSFVHMAIDPEWMFPRHDGIPGTNLSNVRASDINPIIDTVAAIPMRYHVPEKILIIHQYREDGDGLVDPHNAGLAEIADKRNLHLDPRVAVVIHVDSVGGYVGGSEDKRQQYSQWVGDDMRKYHNFEYGGFKLFYRIEAKVGVMSPKDVLTLNPAPLIVTYGN